MKLNKRTYLIFLCALILSISFASAQSKKQKELEAKRQRVLKELRQLNQLYSTDQKKEKSVVNLVEDLHYKVGVRKNLIRITNEQANLLTREINANQKEISSLRTQLQELKDDYADMIVKSYKSKSEQSRVMFLLSSDNFKQAYKRLQYISQYKDYQKQQAEDIKVKTKKLQDLNITLSKQKEEKKLLIKENRIAKRELEAEMKQQETLMASIRKNMGKYTTQIRKKKQEIDRIDKEIDRLVREAIAASNKKAGNKSSTGRFVLTPAGKKLASSFAANKGKLGWPVERGVIRTRFGNQRSTIDKSVIQNSYGIRIATEKNAKVKAVFNGEVSVIHVMKRGNPSIMIRHGDYVSIYMNLAKIYVKKGDKIKTGQEIGEVFTNRKTGESLLWFRIYKNNQKLNPEYWLARN